MTSTQKSAANRRNAQASTGPRTAVGRAASSLNARKHGLNTPVLDHILQSCLSDYAGLLDFARVRAPSGDLADIVYALAVHARLRDRRADLMQSIVSAGTCADTSTEELLDDALEQLRRLETYERKARSRLSRLLDGC